MPITPRLLSSPTLLIPQGKVLLVVPPFAAVNRVPLGVHVLQACAVEAGFQVSILHANLAFAANIGLKNYMAVCTAPFQMLAGERLFAAAAYGIPPLGYDADKAMEDYTVGTVNQDGNTQHPTQFNKIKLRTSELEILEAKARGWIEEIATVIAAQRFKVVGCTTMFDQTAASIALLNRIKCISPNTVTILGGANCEGEMAEGIAALSPKVDYIFSGESEYRFVQFLQQLFAGKRPAQRIFYSNPVHDLDSLPMPDFHQYYEQLEHYLPAVAARPSHIKLSYETSRGCWWGQKHRCTFCGLNGAEIDFREKSPAKIMAELEQLLTLYPTQSIIMADNVMPNTFFKTLMPKLAMLAAERPALKIYYEQKANLSLAQILALMKAGITHIQPGIESLSTSLLKRMNKGTTAAQNIALLRYARSAGMSLDWNLLSGFPGDQLYEYQEILALLPLLHHLEPPTAFFHLSIDRFSPYFDHPKKYNLGNIRPWPSYAAVLPPEADVTKIAYHFNADYACGAHEHVDFLLEIEEKVRMWQADWDTAATFFFGKFKVKERPVLEVVRQASEEFVLRDTRKLPDTQAEYPLSRAQASAALAGRRYEPTPEMEWAIAHKVGVLLDQHHYVPLATAEPELVLEFEAEARIG